MSGTVTPFPTTPEVVTEEERKRRLAVEIERLARLPVNEWPLYVSDPVHAATFGVSCAEFAALVGLAVESAKKARSAELAEQRRAEEHAERQRDREDRRARQAKADERRDAEHDRRAFERDRREFEQAEARRKKIDAVFAEIAGLPKLTHEMRLREAAERLREDVEVLFEEFEVFCASRAIPEADTPWPDPVDTAALLAEIEGKFRRYVVTSNAIATAAVLWTPFTYVVEVAVQAPKLVFHFPEKDAGKTTALHVVRWMSRAPYVATEATGAAVYRIIDRLKPTLFLDEADTIFRRNTALAHIINTSWTNDGSRIPRAKASGKGFDEYDVFGTQALSMKGLNMPDTTQSRCILCQIWPKLPHEIVEKFTYRDDAEFKVIRRKLLRWAIDNAAALQAAVPILPDGFNNRIAANWSLLLAIADMAGEEWAKRARAAALELEAGRDEPSENIRLFAALRDIWGTAKKRTSEDLCRALAEHSEEWANFHDKGPISQKQLAARLKLYGIRSIPVHPTGRSSETRGGYAYSQLEPVWKRLLQKPVK
jgi:hypothetical protein